MSKQITVVAAVSQKHLEQYGADVENPDLETIAEAKVRAKYYLSEEYMNRCEDATRLRYAQVLVDGEVRYDFFGKADECGLCGEPHADHRAATDLSPAFCMSRDSRPGDRFVADRRRA